MILGLGNLPLAAVIVEYFYQSLINLWRSWWL